MTNHTEHRTNIECLEVQRQLLVACAQQSEEPLQHAYLVLERCRESPGHYFSEGDYKMLVVARDAVIMRKLGNEIAPVAFIQADGTVANQVVRIGDIVATPIDQTTQGDSNWILRATRDQMCVIGRVVEIDRSYT